MVTRIIYGGTRTVRSTKNISNRVDKECFEDTSIMVIEVKCLLLWLLGSLTLELGGQTVSPILIPTTSLLLGLNLNPNR